MDRRLARQVNQVGIVSRPVCIRPITFPVYFQMKHFASPSLPSFTFLPFLPFLHHLHLPFTQIAAMSGHHHRATLKQVRPPSFLFSLPLTTPLAKQTIQIQALYQIIPQSSIQRSSRTRIKHIRIPRILLPVLGFPRQRISDETREAEHGPSETGQAEAGTGEGCESVSNDGRGWLCAEGGDGRPIACLKFVCRVNKGVFNEFGVGGWRQGGDGGALERGRDVGCRVSRTAQGVVCGVC